MRILGCSGVVVAFKVWCYKLLISANFSYAWVFYIYGMFELFVQIPHGEIGCVCYYDSNAYLNDFSHLLCSCLPIFNDLFFSNRAAHFPLHKLQDSDTRAGNL